MGFTNPVGTGGVVGRVSVFWLRWCGWCRWVCGYGGLGPGSGAVGVGGGGVVAGGCGVLCLCEVRVLIICVDGRSKYLCIALGAYLHI